MKAVNIWITLKIKDILQKIIGGGTPSKSKPEYWNGSIPWASVKDMKDEVYKLHSTVDSITEIGLKNSSSNLIPKGNVIISTRMGLGRCFIPSIDIAINQDLKALIPKQEVIDTNYLLWLMASLSEKLQLLGIGTTVKGITIETLKNLEIKIPPLPIQRKIVSILSTYDDLIENNTRRIKILEEMAQTLYHEWFVKFRFPGHEQVNMVESELGLIPEGWEVSKLEHLGLLARGKSKHRPRNEPSLFGGNYPFIQTGEVKEASLYITNYTQTYNDNGLAQSKLWDSGTLLITIAANIAETAILNFKACFPDSIVGFVPNTYLVSTEFIKYSIDTLKIRMQNISKGTTQDNLSLEKIKIFNFLLPEEKIMQLFISRTTPLYLQIKNLLLKNHNLRKTRDLLLPKLISGEIDVENLDIDNLDIAA